MPLNPKAYLAQDALDPKNIKQIPTRDGYGDGLVLAGEKDKNVVVLCADLTESTRALAFKKKFPDRFVQMGVSEQSMASIAAGMAMAGKVPFISSYAMFSPGRNWEQIRTTVCLNNVNVKIAGAHAGVSVGPDGATHQAIEDIAILRPIANMRILVPCDAMETRKATLAAAQSEGPVYLRFAREKTPLFTTEKTPFAIGKAAIFFASKKQTADVALIACGPLTHEALLAARKLEARGVSVYVVNCPSVKPLDEKLITEVAKKSGAIVTVEEHQVTGGLGGAVAELLTKTYPVPMEFIGVQNQFGQSGTPRELLEHFRLTAPWIEKAALRVMKKRVGSSG